jgi:hypothetical protein
MSGWKQSIEAKGRHLPITVFWSDEDHEFVAIHPNFPSLSYLDPDRRKAKRGMRKLIKFVKLDLRTE